MLSRLVISPEVAPHLGNNHGTTPSSLRKPVVALESTIISHGMPYPQNVQVAKEVEDIIRAKGAIPATIAILDGQICIGLTPAQLERLGGAPGKKESIRKVSRRDLAEVVALGQCGATTVAATMMLSSLVGIKVFVTGGIGGVHRASGVAPGGNANSPPLDDWDVSADLEEFSKSPVAVVCAGAKSILDLPRTLEVLETRGVPVLGYGTSEFPSFFTRKSGLKLNSSVSNAEDCAKIVEAQCNSGFASGKFGAGMVICNPIPEKDEYPEVEKAIQVALKELEDSKRTANPILGKDATPFLLKRVNELTGGKSLEANIALVKNNAKVGAEVAVAMSRLTATGGNQNLNQQKNFSEAFDDVAGNRNSSRNNTSGASSAEGTGTPSSNGIIERYPPNHFETDREGGFAGPRITVLGGATVDYMCKPDKQGNGGKDVLHTSLPGVITSSCGGVGRNIAEAIANLGGKVTLCTALGGDNGGHSVVQDCQRKRIGLRARVFAEATTAQYACVFDSKGELLSAVADMAVLEKIPAELATSGSGSSSSSGTGNDSGTTRSIFICDGNLHPENCMRKLASANSDDKRIWFDPVSVPKAIRYFALPMAMTELIAPNYDELEALIEVLSPSKGGQKNTPENSRANSALHGR